MQALLEGDAKSILSAQAALNALSTNFDVRKVAACVKEHQETFYILCGWMSEGDCKSFMAEIEHDPNLFCVVEVDQNQVRCKPPTKLKNPKFSNLLKCISRCTVCRITMKSTPPSSWR